MVPAVFVGRVTACAVDGTFRSKNQPAVRCHSGLLYKQRYIDTTNTTGTYSEQSSGASSLVFASWFQFRASRNANIRDWSIDKDLRARLRYLFVNGKLTSQTAFPQHPQIPHVSYAMYINSSLRRYFPSNTDTNASQAEYRL